MSQPSRSAARRAERPPLDQGRLDRLALRYVERYATTRAKLAFYLRRKLRERGWAGCEDPPVEALVERFAALGYVDDKAFAAARGEALGRRGYGPRRVDQALKAAGVADEDSADARDAAGEGAWEAALAYARRRRLGPFAAERLEGPAREKALAALVRAGHSFDHARRLVAAPPGEMPDAPI